ncbi:Chromosome transmission fidelity protein 18 [Knufia fluminis]|uniref:Chromosome transmission fidelity protein 18 n=1 Tax=Knufia fluminis TaxID=191047 RepID=A0AAN8I4V6_9EURO|nr:Chromosome transmission fidelity protein 18 [Knufia fluminis]
MAETGSARIDSGIYEQEEVPDMTFSSSPVQYPASSSPAPAPAPRQKRRLFQTLEANQPASKRPRLSPSNDQPGPDKQLGPLHIIEEEEPRQNLLAHESSADAEDIDTILAEEPRQDTPSQFLPLQPTSALNLGRGLTRRTTELQTCSGKAIRIASRKKQAIQTYEQVIADRSTTAAGRAKRSYYGLEIHKLIDDAKIQKELDDAAKEAEAQKQPLPSIERPLSSHRDTTRQTERYKHQMWTEKYRAKRFTDLVGDERTHRSVLRWLKAWDTIVFPGNTKAKSKKIFEDKDANPEQAHRKILLLAGPPGLGKTTLAHVCARQAGYGVLEINASDDRSRDVVKGRIKDALGTETVRGIQEPGKARKAGRPVCVVVDEVDGVVTGSGGGGEGGFMKALIDLVQLDQRNTAQVASTQNNAQKGKKKGDRFRLLRPLILICNDVYAPSLRPLRQSSLAEIVHVRKPPLDKVVTRLKSVFEKENIRCDNDAVRRLCEDAWGLGSRKASSNSGRGSGDGDIRGLLVQGEWMAHKLRLHAPENNGLNTRLTRKWIDSQIAESSAKGPKALGRGGTREVLERIFIEGAGLPNLPTTLSPDEQRQFKESKSNPIGVSDLRKRAAISSLREMIDTVGDHDRIVTDCFATYGTHVFQDDTFLSKPNTSYDWLHFHDSVSSRIYSGQEWELNPYLSTPACAFHHLFSNVDKGTSGWAKDAGPDNQESEEQTHPFAGPKADFAAYEAEKANKTILSEMQGNFSGEMLRLFSSMDVIATELIPSLSRMLSPDVKPVVVGGSGGSAPVASVRRESERTCVRASVHVMNALGIAFEKVRIENEGFGGGTTSGGFALRMEPPIDTLSTYHISSTTKSTTATTTQPTRYAIRQVLDQELRKEKLLQASQIRLARGGGALTGSLLPVAETDDKENLSPSTTDQKPTKMKRDFFGRPVVNHSLPTPPPETGAKIDASTIAKSTAVKGKARTETNVEGEEGRIWMSFHEGFSNAVRKPITLSDLMEGF